MLMRFHIYLPAEEAASLASAFHTVAAFSVLLHYLHSAKVLVKTKISFLSSYEGLDFRGLRVLSYTAGLLLGSRSERTSAAVHMG